MIVTEEITPLPNNIYFKRFLSYHSSLNLMQFSLLFSLVTRVTSLQPHNPHDIVILPSSLSQLLGEMLRSRNPDPGLPDRDSPHDTTHVNIYDV